MINSFSNELSLINIHVYIDFNGFFLIKMIFLKRRSSKQKSCSKVFSPHVAVCECVVRCRSNMFYFLCNFFHDYLIIDEMSPALFWSCENICSWVWTEERVTQIKNKFCLPQWADFQVLTSFPNPGCTVRKKRSLP